MLVALICVVGEDLAGVVLLLMSEDMMLSRFDKGPEAAVAMALARLVTAGLASDVKSRGDSDAIMTEASEATDAGTKSSAVIRKG